MAESKQNAIKITSTSFKEGGIMEKKYTAYAENISPNLKWSNFPSETKSFVIVMDDPDAQKVCGYTFIHWILKDIPANVTEFPEGKSFGTGIENHAKTKEYFGPMPPKGTGAHGYYFKLFALKVEKVNANDYTQLMKEVEKNKCGEGVLIGKYEHFE